MKISASFLAEKKIEKAIYKLDHTDADYIHVDVVDGKFVDGKKIPLRKLKKIYKLTSKRLDVHLMVKKPKKYIKKFVTMNAERIIIHLELKKDLEKNLELIHKFGIKNGLAINPNTDISYLEPYLDKIDSILVMSVMPGYGGQKFIENTTTRLIEIKKMLLQHPNIEIMVDGGINEDTIEFVKIADIVVSGSYITKSKNYQDQIDKLRQKKKNRDHLDIPKRMES
ncbi:MAG: ribulose-phosphate 3-epimerase [bacterium]|nr:ribulose-phosphate 3-epimerase [bacterium]